MKKRLLVLLGVVLVATVVAQPALADGWWGSTSAELSRHQYQSEHSQMNPYGYYNPNGYHHGYYGPGPNTDVRSRERWEGNKGEREFSQTQNLPAKVIDAATILGALLIIF